MNANSNLVHITPNKKLKNPFSSTVGKRGSKRQRQRLRKGPAGIPKQKQQPAGPSTSATEDPSMWQQIPPNDYSNFEPAPAMQHQQSRNIQPLMAKSPQQMSPLLPKKIIDLTYFNFEDVPQSIIMDTGDPIYLDLQSQMIYQPGKINYPSHILQKSDLWHQVVVHHEGRVEKEDILCALFSLVKAYEFFPIGYRSYARFDSFLLTASDRSALEVLFNKNLCLQIIQKRMECTLSVRLGSGKITSGQMHPKTQLEIVVREMLEKASLYGSGELDFERFHEHPALREVCITFMSYFHLSMVLKSFLVFEKPLLAIKSIRLPFCKLERLEALRHLQAFKSLVYLDLRNNNIKCVMEFKHISRLTLIKLDISSNPFMKEGTHHAIYKDVKKIIPSLKIIDNNEIDQPEGVGLATTTDSDYFITDMQEGDLITPAECDYMTFRQKYRNSPIWHRVVVHHNGRLTRKQIVSRLLGIVENNDLWMCYYTSYARQDEFYVLANVEALEVLVRSGLQVGPQGGEAGFVVNLYMNVAKHHPGQVDVPKKIQLLATENCINKNLYLGNLASKDIFQNVVIDMSAPRVLSQILLLASRKVGANCVSLDLSNNGIVAATGMYPLVWFTKLSHLDLSHNKIDDFEKLHGLPQGNKITSVKLSGNPLCVGATLSQYITGVKHYFNDLEKLDGRSVDINPKYMSRQNFLAQPECYALVEAFLKHFFMDYDSGTRLRLKEMYARTAQFTISCNFQDSKTKDQYGRVAKYMARGRNISKIVNMSLYTRNVFVGAEEILRTINDLHITEHDFMSFNVDVPMYTGDKLLVIVNGIFKDKPMALLEEEMLIDFTRTFFIRAVNCGMGVSEQSFQYQIFNDLLTVKNISVNQKMTAFKAIPFASMEEVDDKNSNEKEALLTVFREMTGLNSVWCTRCLTEAKWNLKVALNVCVKLMEDGRVPEDAFI